MVVPPELLEASLNGFDAWMDLEAVVRDDAISLLNLANAEPDDQTLRRAFVRGAWAYKEGSINGLSHWLATVEDLTGNRHEKRPRERSKTLDRIKSTFKWASARLTPGWAPDFGGAGWAAVQESIRCRDRLMHPKTASDFQVNDQDEECVRAGLQWFVEALTELQKRAHDRARAAHD